MVEGLRIPPRARGMGGKDRSMTNAEKSVLFSDAAMRVQTARFKGILWRAAFVAALAADAETAKAQEPKR